MEQISIRKAELNSRLLRAKSDEEEQDAMVKELEQEFEAVTREITAHNDAKKKMEDRAAQIKLELTSMDQHLRETQEQYHQEKSKLEALSNLTERYEGYGGSVKKVMEQKDTLLDSHKPTPKPLGKANAEVPEMPEAPAQEQLTLETPAEAPAKRSKMIDIEADDK